MYSLPTVEVWFQNKDDVEFHLINPLFRDYGNVSRITWGPLDRDEPVVLHEHFSSINVRFYFLYGVHPSIMYDIVYSIGLHC